MGGPPSRKFLEYFNFDKEKDLLDKYSTAPSEGVVICDSPGLLVQPISHGKQMPHSDLATFGIYTFLVR
jgi:hypothetical protein